MGCVAQPGNKGLIPGVVLGCWRIILLERSPKMGGPNPIASPLEPVSTTLGELLTLLRTTKSLNASLSNLIDSRATVAPASRFNEARALNDWETALSRFDDASLSEAGALFATFRICSCRFVTSVITRS